MRRDALGYMRKLDLAQGRIDMTHGAGGRSSAQLVRDLFLVHFDNPALRAGNDAAVLAEPPPGHCLVMATDAHVVSPLFFPGGDIGCLAVNGTVNDLAMLGATPLYLSASFILEEGLPLSTLARVVSSMGEAARACSVQVVAGDTKVVQRGKGDGVFIASTGVGLRPALRKLDGAQARPGDTVLISGSIADHGIAVLAEREGLSFETPIESDCAALGDLVATLLAAVPEGAVHVLRDPTRGGLGTTLNEIAAQSGVGFTLQESAILVKPQVAAACELLGLDPLYIANEGKFLAVVAPQAADAALAALNGHPLGRQAARIGEVSEDAQCFVQMRTRLGGRRVVDWLGGEPLPRIC